MTNARARRTEHTHAKKPAPCGSVPGSGDVDDEQAAEAAPPRLDTTAGGADRALGGPLSAAPEEDLQVVSIPVRRDEILVAISVEIRRGDRRWPARRPRPTKP